MDLQIGRVRQALDANGMTENTIIIFTSDNGGERFADTWPFTGRKTELLEGGLRIPAIICWPARIPQGRTDRSSRHQHGLDANSVGGRRRATAGLSTRRHQPAAGAYAEFATAPRKLFWRYKANAQRAARDGDYKYLKILDNTFLFNVVDDPMERANLKERHNDIYDACDGVARVERNHAAGNR